MNTLKSQYHARLELVLRYIDEHLMDELNVEQLSKVAAFSRYHFHRQFSLLLGINVHRYIQLARLKRASYRLAFREEQSILEIAIDSGYEGPEAFARAFRKRVGQTPSEFRVEPEWMSWQDIMQPVSEVRVKYMQKNLQREQVRLVEVADARLAMLEHRGSPSTIFQSVKRFITWRKSRGLSPKNSQTFNVLFDDPTTTPPDQFRFGIGVATETEGPDEREGIIVFNIPAGRCAVLRHIGSDDTLGESVRYLYAEWLPESGQEPRDFPLYCQRIAFFPDVAEHEAVTDIFLPLR